LDPDEVLAVGADNGVSLTRRDLQSFVKDIALMRKATYDDTVQYIESQKMSAQQFVDMYHHDFQRHMKRSASEDDFASADEG
jgi:hypothetical protein